MSGEQKLNQFLLVPLVSISKWWVWLLSWVFRVWLFGWVCFLGFEGIGLTACFGGGASVKHHVEEFNFDVVCRAITWGNDGNMETGNLVPSLLLLSLAAVSFGPGR